MTRPVIAQYTCIEDIPLYRGGDFVGITFIAGSVYSQVGWDRKDAVLINEAGGEHLMPPGMLARRFRKKDKDDNDTEN